MEELRNNIEATLPSLSNEILEKLLSCLTDAGVETLSDLPYVQEADLKSVLRPVQIRKLLQAWGIKESAAQPHELPESPSTSSPQATSDPPSVPHTLNADWASEFPIPWDQLSSGFRKSLKNKTRPHPADRRAMVRTVIVEAVKIRSHPLWKACEAIARKIVHAHPDSLEDRLEGDRVGNGYHSLAKQLQGRWENVNRGKSSNNQQSKRKRSTAEIEGNPTPPAPKKDKYGCVAWQPDGPPEGHDEESLRVVQEELQDLHQNSRNIDDSMSAVMEKMTLTFFIQRLDINSGAPIVVLMKDWPFLFTKAGMSSHFKQLVGLNIEETLCSALDSKLSRILTFMKTVKKTAVMSVMSDIDSSRRISKDQTSETSALLLAVMAYFDEKPNGLFFLTEKTSTPAEVEGLADIPDTPCIVACGDCLLNCANYCLVIDHRVAVANIGIFDTALTLLLASFYCFNIIYPLPCSSTLEFFQRCFLKINPDHGRKTSQRGKTYSMMSAKVLALINHIADHEWTD